MALAGTGSLSSAPWDNGKLEITSNGRYLQHENGTPFFWVGDTAWLIPHKLTRPEVDTYMANRSDKFNVVMLTAVHGLHNSFWLPSPWVNAYGHEPFNNATHGNFKVVSGAQNDYWDHVDYIVDKAAEHGIYIALAPSWGEMVVYGHLNPNNTYAYYQWFAERYRNRPNIIWITGGDKNALWNYPQTSYDTRLVWPLMGQALQDHDTNHLVSYHPNTQVSSSDAFHTSSWLDFNMIQSGHIIDDNSDNNYIKIVSDWNLTPVKPTFDGEIAYEHMPNELVFGQTRITAWDSRRRMYWSVFSGALGVTYGNLNIFPFYKPGDNPNHWWGPNAYWYNDLNSEGALSAKHLKDLMTSLHLPSRVPDQTIIRSGSQTGHGHMRSMRGNGWALAYIPRGQNCEINFGKITGTDITCQWFNPKTGAYQNIGTFTNTGYQAFNPPGSPADGNDWVLVMTSEAPPSGTVDANAFYYFDEGSGTTAADSSANGNQGTLTGGAGWTTGYTTGSGAVSLDGTDDYVAAADSASLDLSGSTVTLGAWVNMNATSGYRVVVSKFPSYELNIREGRVRLETGLAGGGSFRAETSSAHITTNDWFHVAAVRNGSTIKLYVDGVSQPITYLNTQSSANIAPNNNQLRIGRRSNGNLYFSGAITEAAVFDEALTDTQVAELADAQGGSQPSTNLLDNPGFENGTTSWFSAAASIQAITSQSHSGTSACRVYNRTATHSSVRQNLTLANGNTYHVSAWVKLASGTGTSRVMAIVTVGGTNYFRQMASASVNSSGWTEISGQYTFTESGPITAATIYIDSPQLVDLYVDDVSVSED